MNNDVAIIGMAVDLPGIKTLDSLWKLLADKKDLVNEFPKYRRELSMKHVRLKRARAIKPCHDQRLSFYNGCFLNDVEKFDYRFFNMTPMQAKTTDLHHKLMIKTLYRAVENAGYAGDRIKGTKTGVFIGFASNPGQDFSSYLADVDPNLGQVSLTGTVPCMLANRISHFMDLYGPSMLLDTACSASLVATLTAARSLSNRECDIALVGGARVCTPISDPASKIGIESSDGRTRTFDISADGTGLGEGSGAIVLKRLEDAIRDNDQIYSVIKGGAINNDGATEGITTPDSNSQARLLAAAWENARVAGSTISYIEAHGTGTKVGDPIEIEGIRKAFAESLDCQKVAIGTIKTNIGHLFESSGIMGVIKTSLMLHKKKLLPIANFSKLNPLLALENSPIYVNTELKTWESQAASPLRSGVSAFGLGGTNCHVIFEEAPKAIEVSIRKTAHLFVMSAATQLSFDLLRNKYIAHLKNDTFTDDDLNDFCYTLFVGRKHLKIRAACIVTNKNELLDRLLHIHPVTLEKGETEAQLNWQKNEFETLQDIQSQFLSGVQFNLESSSKILGGKITSAPDYAYDEQDCFIYYPPNLSSVPDNFKGDHLQTYRVVYVEDALDATKISHTKENVIIFDAERSPRATELKKILLLNGSAVKIVRFGSVFDIKSEDITIKNSEEEFLSLAKYIREENFSHVIHLTSSESRSDDVNNLAEKIEHKLISLFQLSKAIIASSFRCRLSVITENACYVETQDVPANVSPENASLLGLARVIPRETPFVTIKSIDVDSNTPSRSLAIELALLTDTRLTVLRNNIRYVEQFEYFDIDSSKYSKARLKNGGTYLVTGGLGAIGLEVARGIASTVKANIILTGRKGLPDRNAWHLLTEKDGKIFRAVKAVQELEASGSVVTLRAVDFGVAAEIEKCMQSIYAEFGHINGVIHAAGNPGTSMISMRARHDVDTVILPKIIGTSAIKHYCKGRGLEFLLLFSSVAAVFPAAGQGDYAAANAFMDAFAEREDSEEFHVSSLQWVAWRDIGMAVDYNSNQDTTFKAIPTDIGMACLEQALFRQVPCTFVGEINYSGEIVNLLTQFGIKLSNDINEKILASQNAKDKSENVYGNPVEKEKVQVELSGRSSDNYSKTEKEVAQIWANSLGYEDLNIQDGFLSIGGESITAIMIVAALSKHFDVTVDVALMLKLSSIEKLSEHIDKQLETEVQV